MTYIFRRPYLRVAAERNKRYYDTEVRPIEYHEWDEVYCFRPRKYKGRSDKLAKTNSGRLVISKMIGNSNAVIKGQKQNSHELTVHVDKLKHVKTSVNKSSNVSTVFTIYRIVMNNNRNKHMRCPICGSLFQRRDTLKYHVATIHKLRKPVPKGKQSRGCMDVSIPIPISEQEVCLTRQKRLSTHRRVTSSCPTYQLFLISCR